MTALQARVSVGKAPKRHTFMSLYDFNRLTCCRLNPHVELKKKKKCVRSLLLFQRIRKHLLSSRRRCHSGDNLFTTDQNEEYLVHKSGSDVDVIPSDASTSSSSSSSGLGGFVDFTFTQEPQDTVTVRGGVLQLDCQAQCDVATGPVAITWRKDGVLLSAVVDDRRRQLTNGSLLVQNVVHSRHHRPDEGEYQCLATVDGLGSIVSRTAKVTVAGPLKVVVPTESVSSYLGDTALLRCEVSGDPTPVIRWQKNREDLPTNLDPDSRLAALPSGSLQVSRVQPPDSATYRCLADNPGSTRTGTDGELRVLPEPGVSRNLQFLQRPSRVAALLGTDAVLECSASGYPTPSVQWTRGDEQIQSWNKKYSLLAGSNLIIRSVTDDDSGVYSCAAANKNQNITAQAELSVLVDVLQRTWSPVALSSTSSSHNTSQTTRDIAPTEEYFLYATRVFPVRHQSISCTPPEYFLYATRVFPVRHQSISCTPPEYFLYATRVFPVRHQSISCTPPEYFLYATRVFPVRHQSISCTPPEYFLYATRVFPVRHQSISCTPPEYFLYATRVFPVRHQSISCTPPEYFLYATRVFPVRHQSISCTPPEYFLYATRVFPVRHQSISCTPPEYFLYSTRVFPVLHQSISCTPPEYFLYTTSCCEAQTPDDVQTSSSGDVDV
ncbi:hypothetical protein F2P81_015859 [Scophthalmus maximus]|uniref:Ig-like domain-containing protein n=1 Tax=Scophthalmus maximus TaxID=52904 RepID=A0A6A4SJX9_SCOMX|nr:hypothetical protein F2P81_015859 [Scophthalmus maximus]